ncbi:NUDIX domain-containing protein [Thozetella sp. PMI_491]|nr:NUDIX domain-containing protein [Thozetella sp. PMI_491]
MPMDAVAAIATRRKSPLLDLIDIVDRSTVFTYIKVSPSVPADFDYNGLFKLLLPNDDRPHGFMLPTVVDLMPWAADFVIDAESRTIQLTDSSGGSATGNVCSKAFQETIDSAIQADIFRIMHGEHSELYPILGANFPVTLERFPAPLFGIAIRGAHMTAYTRLSTDPLPRIWVARRNLNLFTYPGMLDTSVAGGVKAGDSPLDCIVAEANEEASLPQQFVRQHAQAAGLVTYTTRQASTGYIVPTVLYVFDIKLPETMTLIPNDTEVDTFYLWTVQQVLDAMLARRFKPNCALVMIDFFVRHGLLTEETVPDYIEVVTRLRRRLPVPLLPV